MLIDINIYAAEKNFLLTGKNFYGTMEIAPSKPSIASIISIILTGAPQIF